MTGQDLKNSILQLAIQGKLVPQDANDEPASVLLERIKAEKKKLIEEKKIKKEKPLAEITEDEMPFEIPENWVWCRWGDLSFSIQYGYNASAQQSGDIRMVRISDIQNNEVLWNTVPFCAIKKEEIDGYLLEPNDILFARTGGTVGKSFLVKTVPYPAIYAGYLIRTRYSKELVPQYLKFFMESNLYWGQLKEGTIATAQPNCNGKTLSNMILPLPPLSEQRRIVAKIEELMPLIDEYDKAQKELDALNSAMPEQLKQSLLQEAIMGKLGTNNPDDEPASELLKRIREEKAQLIKEKKIKKEKPLPEITEEEMPFEIPENWEWVRVAQIMSVKGGKRVPLGCSWTTTPTNHIYIRVTDMKNGSIVNRDLRYITDEVYEKIKSYTISKDDLYITVAGTIGNVGIVPDEFNGMNLTENADKLTDISINKNYIVKCFNSPFIQEQIKALTNQMAQPKLSIRNILTLLFPLPPLSEQHRIVEKLDALLPMISELAKSK